MNSFNKTMFAWLLTSLSFWTFYIVKNDLFPKFLYYYIILFFVGIPFWIFRFKIKNQLQSWKLNNLVKFIILGYAMVLFEEIFAALTNHLSEGFDLLLFIKRIGQFWTFNVLAFTGFIFAWYFLIKKYKYTYSEIFFVAGFWGIFVERVFNSILRNSAYVFITAPIMMFVYGIIITPSMLSAKLSGNKELRPWIKYPLSLFAIYLFSIIPIFILKFLRIKYPDFFPPVEFIPL